MIGTPFLAPQAVAEAHPVDSSERVLLLDVLRGFALCGVFMANAYVLFSGRGLLPKERAERLMASPVNVAAHHLFELLVSGKAMSLLSPGAGEPPLAGALPLRPRRVAVALADLREAPADEPGNSA